VTDSKHQKIAKIVRDFIPPFLIRKITGIFYGWRGNYSSWEAANKKCTGYNASHILDKVIQSSLKVKDGGVAYERDSVTFDKIIYSFPVLAGLMWIAARNDGRINVLDFGGSLGSSYFQNKKFLESLKEFNWCIVEQPHYVKIGKEKFAGPNLHFFYSIDECLRSFTVDVMIFSSVLQYLEKPYGLIDEIISKNPKYIIIDLTRFINEENDRLTIQKVPGWIYKAKYCCWFFNEEKFRNYFSPFYDLVFDFEIPETINIRSVCKGYFFQKK